VLKYKAITNNNRYATKDKVTELFWMADDFCKFFDIHTKFLLSRNFAKAC
jgi:hypothetical protein